MPIPGIKKVMQIGRETLRMNDVLEAKTVKGGTNYIIFFFEKDNSVYCMHGDKCKKYPKTQFRDAFEYGDIWKITRENVDPERLKLAALHLQAMMDGMAFNDYMALRHGTGKFSQAQ